MVGLTGLEPVTSPLSGVRSNQLSYRPNRATMIPEGEPEYGFTGTKLGKLATQSRADKESVYKQRQLVRVRDHHARQGSTIICGLG